MAYKTSAPDRNNTVENKVLVPVRNKPATEDHRDYPGPPCMGRIPVVAVRTMAFEVDTLVNLVCSTFATNGRDELHLANTEYTHTAACKVRTPAWSNPAT